MGTIETIDWNLLLLLNGAHTPLLDSFFIAITNKFTWIPLYILIAIVFLKYLGPKNTLIFICGALVCFALTDQISTRIFKPAFERLRPCHTEYGMQVLWLPKGCGGMYGFLSSHAANTMGLAVFCSMVFFKVKIPFKGLVVLMLLSYSILNMLSRVYLGAHYPTDVICGAMLGIILAYVCYKLTLRITSPKKTKK